MYCSRKWVDVQKSLHAKTSTSHGPDEPTLHGVTGLTQIHRTLVKIVLYYTSARILNGRLRHPNRTLCYRTSARTGLIQDDDMTSNGRMAHANPNLCVYFNFLPTTLHFHRRAKKGYWHRGCLCQPLSPTGLLDSCWVRP